MRPVGLAIAAILVTTMLGLVYLTQTLGSNATSSQIGGMTDRGNSLRDVLRTQSSVVQSRMDPTAITRRAGKLGLVQLDDTVVLPAP